MLEPAFFVEEIGSSKASDMLDAFGRLGLTRIATGGWLPGSTRETFEAFARELERRDVKVVSVHGVGTLVDAEGHDERAVAKLVSEVERAALWRSSHLVLHFRDAVGATPWWNSGPKSTAYINDCGVEEFDRRMQAVLAEATARARELGVVIALENLPPSFSYSISAAGIAAFVAKSGLSNLGVCFDTGHAVVGGLDPAEQIRACGPHLATLHLHDNQGALAPTYDVRSSDWHLAPGLGVINWPKVVLALREARYTGPAIFETSKVPGLDFEQAVQWIARFWSAACQVADRLADAAAAP